MAESAAWDERTRELLVDRVEHPPAIRFFDEAEAATLGAFLDVFLGQHEEPRIPALAYLDARLYEGRSDGYRHVGLPDDRALWRLVARGLDEAAARQGSSSFDVASSTLRERIVGAFADAALQAGVWDGIDQKLAWSTVSGRMVDVVLVASVGVEREGFPVRPTRAGTRGSAPTSASPGRRSRRVRCATRPVHESDEPGGPRVQGLAASARQRLGIPARPASAGGAEPRPHATIRDDEEVDLAIVGCGAGGGVLAQRLARRGFRVVVLEAGPFWDPDDDWVSDEAGSHHIYWTENRLIGGLDPVALGKNNSGRGVGGSMVHFAGYTPRFHPSDFEVCTRDGVAADWPIGYDELAPYYAAVELELPVAGQHWPWGDPHGYPHAPHPVSAAARRALGRRTEGGNRDARRARGHHERRVRQPAPLHHRGFCLQGCKVNAKASPLVTHVPDAIEHGVEIRADCMVTRVELGADGRCSGLLYRQDGQEHVQRAAAVAICGYSIETPRLLLNSSSARYPDGLGNAHDQVVRHVMVQVRRRSRLVPQLVYRYKAPPPTLEPAVLRA